jgi:hypothetical protein
MTSLEEVIREAFGAKADQIPPDTVPPLRLPARRRRSLFLAHRGGGRKGMPARPSRPGWLAPAGSVVLVAAVIAGSLTLSRAITGQRAPSRHQQAAVAIPAAVPRYYVALTGANEGYPTSATAAVVRATATGAVVARVVPPRPYATFTGVTAAADDRTFVLSAQVSTARSRALYPDARFFILRTDPASHSPGGRAQLQALPARYVPAGSEVSGMALSPDGTRLAATTYQQLTGSLLDVFDLATGTQRTWSGKLCSRCLPGLIGFGFGGVNVGTLSWTGDGRTLAFTWASAGQGDVRLLDTAAPGANLLADSKLAIATPNGPGPYWRTAIITPSGRTIVAVRELTGPRPGGRGLRVRQELVKFSVATGKVTAILNHLRIHAGYEQVLWTSGSGRVLVIAGARPGESAGIMRGDRYTAIPWSAGILAAAW